ncbi:hypothetical protein K502DRAFT_6894 [Neoconidiobolus thromboides FSU 785]|nr:hypothetical protein K502DRAFT_6894 [Neoconidiobolus thromboides FSU 785]
MPRKSRSSPNRTQTRRSSTAAASPPRSNAPPMSPQASAQSQPRQPGLFAQMASTAAGVAVGSSIGHSIGNLFGGSSEPAPAEPQQAHYNQSNETYGGGSCQNELKQFTNCMEQSGNDISVCQYYLDMLKACNSVGNQRI